MTPSASKPAATAAPALAGECMYSCQVELLSWRSVKDISGDGGVIKTVVQEGSGWEQCQELYEAKGEARVTCHVARGSAYPPAVHLAASAKSAGGHRFASWLGVLVAGWNRLHPVPRTLLTLVLCGVLVGNPRAVSYTARVAGSETPFAQAEEVVFPVAEGHLVPGLAVAVKTMKKGEKVHLKLKPQCE